MNKSYPPSDDKAFLNRAIETAIRIGLVAIIAVWCFQIVQPFIVPGVWGVIIAVAVYPGYRRLGTALGERHGLAATLFAVLMLVLLIIPAVLLTGTLVDGAQWLAEGLRTGTLSVPPPPESVSRWPLIGENLHRFWTEASQNLEATLRTIGPQFKALGSWLLSAAAGAGLTILQFVLAVIIAAVLLAHASGSEHVAQVIAARLVGDRGVEFTHLAEATVRSVTRGILGVALIQSLLAGLGFLAAGVPGAGLWALFCLLLSVIQIGIFPVSIPILIYVFTTADTLTAVAFMIWILLVGALDNVLKPILLGRGVEVPMAVIFLGAIGGFLSSGIIGLFVGAVVLVLGYKLFLAWLNEDRPPAPAEGGLEPPGRGEGDAGG